MTLQRRSAPFKRENAYLDGLLNRARVAGKRQKNNTIPEFFLDINSVSRIQEGPLKQLPPGLYEPAGRGVLPPRGSSFFRDSLPHSLAGPERPLNLPSIDHAAP